MSRQKEYRITYPELSYRQCLIEVSKQETKPELIEVNYMPEQEPTKKPFEIFEQDLIIN